jgi:hypothetical protein
VIYRCEGNLRSNLLVEILQHYISKILCVVDREVSGDTVAVDDVLPKVFFD